MIKADDPGLLLAKRLMRKMCGRAAKERAVLVVMKGMNSAGCPKSKQAADMLIARYFVATPVSFEYCVWLSIYFNSISSICNNVFSFLTPK